MVDRLGAWYSIILVCTGYFNIDLPFIAVFHFWDYMGPRFWCIYIFFSILIFGHFLNFCVTAKFLIGWNFYIFSRCAGWSSSSYASTICTLRGSALVNGFDWDSIFVWFISWFTSCSFSWNKSLTGTPRGTDEGFAFMNISDRVLNDSLCLFTSFTSGIYGVGFCSS